VITPRSSLPWRGIDSSPGRSKPPALTAESHCIGNRPQSESPDHRHPRGPVCPRLSYTLPGSFLESTGQSWLAPKVGDSENQETVRNHL
jgi:hypothetical protein